MNIFAEVTIDETGIIKQIDAVKEAADRFEDEALPCCISCHIINVRPFSNDRR